MAIIALKGMRFHSFHGYYTEEQSVGNNYEIDVYITRDLAMDAMHDDLDNTLNYETIYEVCKAEMQVPKRLIETVASNILKDLRKKFGTRGSCKVCIRKLNPLLGGLVDYALIEIEG